MIRHQLGIAVYRNSRDDVAIRQQDEYGDGDHFVYVSKDNVPKLVQALLEAAGFERATTYGEPLLLPKPEVEVCKIQAQGSYRCRAPEALQSQQA